LSTHATGVTGVGHSNAIPLHRYTDTPPAKIIRIYKAVGKSLLKCKQYPVIQCVILAKLFKIITCLNMKIKKVAVNTYIITPYNVDLLGDLIDELENNGLYF